MQFVYLLLDERRKRNISAMLKWMGLGRQSHGVLFYRYEDEVIARVFFYGTAVVADVKLGKVSNGFREFDGYLCDWQHGREGLFGSFLHKMAERMEAEAIAGIRH